MNGQYALAIIGEPGIGKSTVTAALTADLPYEEALQPFAHRVYSCGVWELGRRREDGFGGTDALSMSVLPTVEQFIEGIRPKLLLFEGDRLANPRFFDCLRKLGYDLDVAVLYAGNGLAASRRKERGSSQNAAWVAGRATKVKRLGDAYADVRTKLNAVLAPDVLALRLPGPVATTLREAHGVPA